MRFNSLFTHSRPLTPDELSQLQRAPHFPITIAGQSVYSHATTVHDQTRSYCAKCPFTLPPIPSVIYQNHGNLAWKMRVVTKHYTVVKPQDRLDWEKLAAEHAKIHGFHQCDRCGELVKSIKTHQKSSVCESNHRISMFQDAGWVQIDTEFKVIKTLFDLEKERKLNQLSWDDRERWVDVEKEHLQSYLELIDKSGIQLAPTDRSKSKNEINEVIGWVWAAWAAPDVADVFRRIIKKYDKLTSSGRAKTTYNPLDDFREWLNAEPEQRDSIVCLWELAAEKGLT